MMNGLEILFYCSLAHQKNNFLEEMVKVKKQALTEATALLQAKMCLSQKGKRMSRVFRPQTVKEMDKVSPHSPTVQK